MAGAPSTPGILAIGDEIRARRRALALGQQELADLSGASVRFIRGLEHGKQTVRLDKLLVILDALGLELRTQLRTR